MALHFGLHGIFLAHCAACVWYAIGAFGGGGAGVAKTDPYSEWRTADAYVASLYWAITTMSTIGYGDNVADTTLERLFCSVTMVIGSCFYAYGITSVIASVSGVNAHERRLLAQRDQLNRYLSRMEVPKPLQHKLREYFCTTPTPPTPSTSRLSSPSSRRGCAPTSARSPTRRSSGACPSSRTSTTRRRRSWRSC